MAARNEATFINLFNASDGDGDGNGNSNGDRSDANGAIIQNADIPNITISLI